MRALLLATIVSVTSGCTLIGATSGAAIGMYRDHEADERRDHADSADDEEDERGQALPGAIVGGGLGLIVDLILLAVITSKD
jgi:hypothetical protein